MIILALESSTTSAKTLLFDSETGHTSVRSRRFEVPGPDTSVRDPDAIYTQLMALGREAAAGVAVDLIVLSGTWHGLTLVDDDLRVITPVREWPDTSAQDLSARERGDADFTWWFYERTGCMVNAIYPAFKLAWLSEQGVSLDGRLALDQASLNFARMTGEASTNISLASGTGMLGADSLEWDAEVLDRLGIADVRRPCAAPATPCRSRATRPCSSGFEPVSRCSRPGRTAASARSGTGPPNPGT